MALQQIIQHPTGTYSQYWKIRSIVLNHTTGTGSITVDGYVSQAARETGKIPLDNRTVEVTDYPTWFAPAVIDAAGMNEVKAGYLFLKSIVDGEFVGAVDV
jgi:hypothetical protein